MTARAPDTKMKGTCMKSCMKRPETVHEGMHETVHESVHGSAHASQKARKPTMPESTTWALHGMQRKDTTCTRHYMGCAGKVANLQNNLKPRNAR